MLAYLRMSLIQKQDKEKEDKAGKEEESLLLVSSPVDPEFELLVVAMGVNLLEDLLKNRFERPTIEEDMEDIKKETSWRRKFGFMHKTGLKKILRSSLHLLINDP